MSVRGRRDATTRQGTRAICRGIFEHILGSGRMHVPSKGAGTRRRRVVISKCTSEANTLMSKSTIILKPCLYHHHHYHHHRVSAFFLPLSICPDHPPSLSKPCNPSSRTTSIHLQGIITWRCSGEVACLSVEEMRLQDQGKEPSEEAYSNTYWGTAVCMSRRRVRVRGDSEWYSQKAHTKRTP